MSLVLGLLLAAVGETAVQTEQTADPLGCRRQAQTGSRLTSSKVCLTQSQREVKQREERIAVEQAQATMVTKARRLD
jgi:hypothetical protein